MKTNSYSNLLFLRLFRSVGFEGLQYYIYKGIFPIRTKQVLTKNVRILLQDEPLLVVCSHPVISYMSGDIDDLVYCLNVFKYYSEIVFRVSNYKQVRELYVFTFHIIGKFTISDSLSTRFEFCPVQEALSIRENYFPHVNHEIFNYWDLRKILGGN